MKHFLSIALASLALQSPAFALPAQVVLIRHGEKPPTGNQLTQQGCERAYALPSFFSSNLLANAYGAPVAIYAQRPDSIDGSLRPAETIAPTAASNHLEIDAQYAHTEFSQMAEEIKTRAGYNGRTVIISWEHHVIPALANALGVDTALTTQSWPQNVYDQAWVIRFSGGTVSLQIVPEFLLPTDNPLGGDNWTNGPQPVNSNSPQVPSAIAQECINNNSLNELMQQLTFPALPSSLYTN